MGGAKTFSERLWRGLARTVAQPILERGLVGPESARRNGRRINERQVEYRYVFDCLNRVAPDSVLDVGSGRTSLPHLIWVCGYRVAAIDNVSNYWPKGMRNRHFRVRDVDVRHPDLEERFDLVTCVSTLEHIDEHVAAVQGMASLANPGGHLLITCPYNESTYVPNAYELEGSTYGQDNPYRTQVFSRAELDSWLEAAGLELVEQELWQVFRGRFWTQGEQVYPRCRVEPEEYHHLTCLLLRRPA